MSVMPKAACGRRDAASDTPSCRTGACAGARLPRDPVLLPPPNNVANATQTVRMKDVMPRPPNPRRMTRADQKTTIPTPRRARRITPGTAKPSRNPLRTPMRNELYHFDGPCSATQLDGQKTNPSAGDGTSHFRRTNRARPCRWPRTASSRTGRTSAPSP